MSPKGCFLALFPVKHILLLPPQLQKKLSAVGLLQWNYCGKSVGVFLSIYTHFMHTALEEVVG